MASTEERACVSARLSHAQYSASRADAALWAGVSVLVTDTSGRILLQSVDYRDACLLPGGAIDAGEAPTTAAGRELWEELGIEQLLTHGLAVDWVPATTPGFHPDIRFPGEIIHVYDGGTWDAHRIQEIRLPDREITAVHWAEPADLPTYMEPGNARRALAALRARINGTGTVLLEDGRPTAPSVMDRLEVLRTARRPQSWPWHTTPVPAGLPLTQCWGWLFAPDGRALVLIGRDTGSACLPGGTLAPGDVGDPAVALRREAREEAHAETGELTVLGHLRDDSEPSAGPRARLRMAGRITSIGPERRDPASGHSYARLLATPEQIRDLFDWGPEGDRQLIAVHRARERLGLPAAVRQPVTEIPQTGGRL
ncbi:NUDIX domain-containing protein [Streptomyces sp. NPDC091377]|uniref:NUDIX hydrolase n=1 Tax=Streptomyces sp. NPDC091377 TaxID=3365995 RepID=UPI00380D0214